MSCKAVKIAEGFGLPVFDFLAANSGNSPNARDEQLCDFLRNLEIDWLVLAGFLRKFPYLNPYEGRVINIHPSLLPKFGGPGMYGEHVHRAVLSARELESGASVHWVSDVYDEGDVISQMKVSTAGCEDASMLAKRVFDAECQLLPKTLNDLICGKLPLPSGQVKVYSHES